MDLWYITLLFLVGFSQCKPEGMFKRDDGLTARVYCGKHLAQTLSTVCKGNYNTLNKKSDIYDPSNSNAAQYGIAVQREPEYPYRSKSKATTLITNFRRVRRRRGVYNECCEKACSVDEMRSYCGS